MYNSDFEYRISSVVRVEKVSLKGPGVIILTGPSSCGKGEVAKSMCQVLSVDKSRHLSMGEILRSTFKGAKSDPTFAKKLADNHHISAKKNIFDCVDTTEELTRKVLNYKDQLEGYFKRNDIEKFVSQLDWLEFCVMHGLLVPNRWTQEFVALHIRNTEELKTKPFILDGYPRTVAAAKHLLECLNEVGIPVIKVLHMSISKQEMLSRAKQRGREDDDEQSLLSRYQFYVESVQPSVDYLKEELGSHKIVLIDAHQPVYKVDGEKKQFQLQASINMVVRSALRSLGVPRLIIQDLLNSL